MNLKTNTNVGIDLILVPQGAEYRAVCRGLKGKQSPSPQVLPIPIGYHSVTTYLQRWQQSPDFPNNLPKRVLLMGLGGSLSPEYPVGAMMIYQGCGYLSPQKQFLWLESSPELTHLLQQLFRQQTVRGFTSDRVINLAEEKRKLGKKYEVDVVDMEGFAVLQSLTKIGIEVGIIRVISDDCERDLPDFSRAINGEGKLKYFPLASAMIGNLPAAIRLIKGSITGLNCLEKISRKLTNVGR